ncbi:MAG: ABC transporter permease [Rhodobacteraceae bacterium]|jgi:putative spermidine/putrescine transport system permease protein|nr:ABC transporter permease [Paracoccaceae bacterium]
MTETRTGAPVAPQHLRMLWMLAPAFVLLLLFFILPYVSIATMSLREASTRAVHGEGWTVSHYTTALTDAYILTVIGRTVLMGGLVTLLALLLGYPVAYHLAMSRSRWTSLLYVCVLSPLLVGLVVRTFAWMIILSNNGVVNQTLRSLGLIDFPLQLMNTPAGVVIALTHVFLPFVVLPLLGNLQAINPEVSMAARSLGASRLRTFLKVTLPLSLPGLQAGAILVFVLSISAYVTPALLGGVRGRTMSVLIVQYLVDTFRWPAGAALATIMAAVALIAVTLFLLLTARAMRRLP